MSVKYVVNIWPKMSIQCVKCLIQYCQMSIIHLSNVYSIKLCQIHIRNLSKMYFKFVKSLFHFVKCIVHIDKSLFHTNIHRTCYRYDNYCTSVQDLLAEIFEAGFSLLHLVKEWVKLGQRQLCNIETQYSCRSECFITSLFMPFKHFPAKL